MPPPDALDHGRAAAAVVSTGRAVLHAPGFEVKKSGMRLKSRVPFAEAPGKYSLARMEDSNERHVNELTALRGWERTGDHYVRRTG